MPLSKLPARGEHITVIVQVLQFSSGTIEYDIVKARVTWTGRGLISYSAHEPGPVGRLLRRRDEGKTWARGWDGIDADALCATLLLQRSVQ
jgi:hypothetical protein